MHVVEAGALAGGADEVVDGALGQLGPALGDEEPGQPVRAAGEVPLDRAQLVAGDRVLDREAVLGALHPQPRLIEVHIVAPQSHRFGDAQAVPVHHQHEQVVAGAVPALLRRVEDAVDLLRAQEVFVALMRVGCMRRGGLGSPTFPLSPVGHGFSCPQKSSIYRKSL